MSGVTWMEVPIVEPRYKPGWRYRLGCVVIRAIGKLAGVEIDFQPLALFSDRLTGYVICPHCVEDNLVTVSLYNETPVICRYCYRQFETMNDGRQIWLLLSHEIINSINTAIRLLHEWDEAQE